MRFWHSIPTLIALAVFAPGVLAQTPVQLAALEKDMEAARVKVGVPGMAVAIVKGDKIVFAKGFGMRDVARKQPVTPDTLFAIGSATKAFTAATVLMAVESGKIQLSDRPRKFLPYFKMHDPETDANLTVRDLLRHSSGLTRTDFLMEAGDATLTRQELIQAASGALPTARLGERFQYQNTMFAAAGEVASKAFGQSYESLIAKRIFVPLGMKRANMTVREILADPNHAIGYSLNSELRTAAPIPMRSIAKTAAAGAINASAREMTHWVRVWLSKGTFEGKKILAPASVAEATKFQMASPLGGYGLGWFLSKWEGVPVVEHGGNIDGFNASVAFIPSQKLGVVVLTNVTYGPLADQATKLVWKHLATKAPAPKDETAAVAENPAQEVGVYRLEGAPVVITVLEKDGKLTAQPTGQPAYPLIPLGGRRYKLGGGLPDGFLATFRPSKADPSITELEAAQPGGAAVFQRGGVASKPYEADVTVDELLARMESAVGDAQKLSATTSLRQSILAEFENQGVTSNGQIVAKAPFSRASKVNLTAVGKPIGWIGDWFNGDQGGQAGSFLPTTSLVGSNLKRTKITSRFLSGIQHLKEDFETIQIAGEQKVGDAKHSIPVEDCYIVKLKARGLSDTATFYVSKSSYQIVRKDYVIFSEAGSVPVKSYFGDFRAIDGITVPFITVTDTPTAGFIVERVQKTEWNVSLADDIFLGPGKKSP